MSHYGNYKPEFSEAQNKPNTGRFVSWMSKVSSQPKKIALVALLALIFGFIICMTGCKTHQTVIKEEIVTRYVDSTIWHTDTSYFEIPVEVYRDYTGLLDTLRLENKYSIAWSAVDTNNMILLGELKSKNIKVPIEYKWKERIVYQDSIVEKTKEVPVEVEVIKKVTPKWAWWTLFICIGLIVYFGIRLYLRFKPL